MTERPILFSTPMVQAILDGRKTMTRRVVKGTALDWLTNGFTPEFICDEGNRAIQKYSLGDILWVRETFAPYVISDFDGSGNDKCTWIYKADGAESQDILDCMEDATWKPSIHMPKSACRIFLEVVSVKVERLQDITEEDAIAEGIESEWDGNATWYKDYVNKNNMLKQAPINSFQSLWNKINGENSWSANPWVWVVEFKRIEKPTTWLT